MGTRQWGTRFSVLEVREHVDVIERQPIPTWNHVRCWTGPLVGTKDDCAPIHLTNLMGQKKESWECTKRRFVLGGWKEALALLPPVIAAVVRTANQLLVYKTGKCGPVCWLLSCLPLVYWCRK